MNIEFYWRSYRYLPYERELALRELKALTGGNPEQKSENFVSVSSVGQCETVINSTTYFAKGVCENGSVLIPVQAMLEASANDNPKKNLLVQRQSTRYSAHGIHEYRGKFNPQVVRAIGNITGLKPKDWVLDPFCGCGTTLLESAHIGWNAIGIDLNPLGILISEAKIAVLKIPLSDLESNCKSVEDNLVKITKKLSFEKAFSQSEITELANISSPTNLAENIYLQNWFKESVLSQLSVIINEIDRLPSEDMRLVLRIILSDILRKVSLQDDSDLRIRRRKAPLENMPVISLFIDSMKGKIQTIVNARELLPFSQTVQRALLGDAKYCSELIRAIPELESVQFDGAITSPPYATALPYIDMHRLSLVLLDLIAPEEIRVLERSLVGNREITRKHREELEQDMELNSSNLPKESAEFCLEMKKALNPKTDGFRKLDKPALVYEYFSNMAMMFEQVLNLLKESAVYALVVGKNRTILGKKPFLIDTPYHLALIAQAKGFAVDEIIDLNTYQRFDIHKENSIRAEQLLLLRK